MKYKPSKNIPTSWFFTIYWKVKSGLLIEKISMNIKIDKPINFIEDFIYSSLPAFLNTGKKLVMLRYIINNSFEI